MQLWAALLAVLTLVQAQNNNDLFNYGNRFKDVDGRNSYPQTEWDAVSCRNVETCSGYPNKYPFGFFSLAGQSNCRWCPEADESINCGLHRQSPIDLLRNRVVQGHPREKDCPDWHFFAFHRDTCKFDDIKGNFEIQRHALQIHIPTLPNGDIDCIKDGKREYPRLDYSKGFPDWWHMNRIDISVPSQHFQEGNQYAAEINLAHFYEKDHFKNHLGHIAIFMQDYEDAEPWAYLDKMICQWRLEEEKVREACGLPPVAPYGRCQLFRDQEPSDEWLVEAGLKFAEDSFTASPLPVIVVEEPAVGPTTPFPTDATITQVPTISPAIAEAPTMSPTIAMDPTLSPTVSDSTLLPTAAISTESPTEADDIVTKAPSIPLPATVPSIFDIIRIPTIPLPPPVVRPVTSPIVLQPIAPLRDYTALPSSTIAPTTMSPSIGAGDSTSEPSQEYIETIIPSDEPSKSPTSATSNTDDTGTDVDGGEGTDTDGTGSVIPPDGEFRVPARIQCRGGVNMERLCEGSDPCCESVRSDSKFCWQSYDTLGPALASACYHCCDTPKIVGPATPLKAGLPQTIQCSTLENPHRMCKRNSCCSDPDNSSSFCQTQRALLGEKMAEACYYCCSEPQDYQAARRARNLRRGELEEDLPEGSRVIETMGRKFLLRKENYVEIEDEVAHFKAIYKEFQRRSLQRIHAVDYEDIDWYAYEWMIKAGTEYYFRYEGTMLVPPCWETVHWRVLKDPIRVHKRQIKELNRLLAWRLNPDTCRVDTAGVLSDDGNTVSVNRELAYNTDIHRKVFCECNDWTSKYEADNEWCEGSDEEGNYERLYERPYSFDTKGEWIPS